MIPADKQTAFNRVWNHLRTQRACANRGVECLYLDETTGRKCAIGVFIPDGHPAQRCAGAVTRLRDRYPEVFEERNGDLTFLRELQNVHDEAWAGGKFRQRLIDVANAYGLTYPKRGWAPGPR